MSDAFGQQRWLELARRREEEAEALTMALTGVVGEVMVDGREAE